MKPIARSTCKDHHTCMHTRVHTRSLVSLFSLSSGCTDYNTQRGLRARWLKLFLIHHSLCNPFFLLPLYSPIVNTTDTRKCLFPPCPHTSTPWYSHLSASLNNHSHVSWNILNIACKPSDSEIKCPFWKCMPYIYLSGDGWLKAQGNVSTSNRFLRLLKWQLTRQVLNCPCWPGFYWCYTSWGLKVFSLISINNIIWTQNTWPNNIKNYNDKKLYFVCSSWCWWHVV